MRVEATRRWKLAEVTFTKDIAPILQRSCQTCHRAEGVAPMVLQTYEDVRPWARAIKQRTSTGRETVGGRFVFHHMIWSTRILGDEAGPADPLAAGDDSTSWPVHEVGREADFDWPGGKPLPEWLVGPTSRNIDATSRMRAFFREHPARTDPLSAAP